MLAIIDYGSGNLRSAAKACEYVAPAGMEVRIITSADALKQASHILLPGVGAFADCMAGLAAIPDMQQQLKELVLHAGTPFLGICVGMQLLAREGLEHGSHSGLGWCDGVVAPIPPAPDIKIPHMGWNNLEITTPHPVLDGIATGDHAYFVHSYHMTMAENITLAATHHGQRLTAMIGKDNWLGTQFHPEKSQKTGLKLLENFLRWRP